MSRWNSILSWCRRKIEALEAVLWPQGVQCLCCDEAAGELLLCPVCASELSHLRLRGQAGPVRSVWAYRGCARQLVIGLKQECVKNCAAVLADEMANAVREMQLPAETVMTWVTMPESRKRIRGIDHGRTLCEAVAERAGLPARRLLERRHRVHTQRGLSAEQRQRNLTGSLACRERITVPVLLIDDVLTTGATTRICSEALRNAGAPCVYVLTATYVNQYDTE